LFEQQSLGTVHGPLKGTQQRPFVPQLRLELQVDPGLQHVAPWPPQGVVAHSQPFALFMSQSLKLAAQLAYVH